jgi:hypothetical protein
MLAMLLQLRLQLHMIPSFSSQLSRFCSKNCMDGGMSLQVLCMKLCALAMLFLE